MKDKTYSEVVTQRFIESWQNLTKLRKPVIAAVNGYAVLPPPPRITQFSNTNANASSVEDVN